MIDIPRPFFEEKDCALQLYRYSLGELQNTTDAGLWTRAIYEKREKKIGSFCLLSHVIPRTLIVLPL